MIEKRELLGYQAELKGEMFRALRTHFSKGEIGSDVIAERLGKPQWRIRKMITGEQDLTLEQMCDLLRALDARFTVGILTFEEIRRSTAAPSEEKP